MNNQVPLTFRIEENILEKCRQIAKISRRSLNSQIELFLDEAVQKYEKEHGEIDIDSND